MAKLPRDLSGRRLRKVLEGHGFSFVRQKGSHMVLKRDRPFALVIVPDHAVLKSGTLRRILRNANLAVGDVLAALGRSES